MKWTLALSMAFSLCLGFPLGAEKTEVKLYQDDVGFWLESEFLTMHPGVLIQVDGDCFTDTKEGNATFCLRRSRIYLQGTIYQTFGYLVTGRWDFWSPKVHDTYIETLGPKCARVRIGYTRIPFSMENLYGDNIWEFTEKSLGVTNFIFRDTGLKLFGIIEGGLEYHIGIYNGRFAAADNNNSKDVVARVVLTPQENIYVGFSGLIGKQTEDLSGKQFITGSGNTSGAGIPFYTFDETAEVNATRSLWGSDLEWLYGPYAIRAEFLHADWGHISDSSPVKSSFKAYSWYIAGTYNLTGEIEGRNKSLIPYNNFEWNTCCYGALQLVARYERLAINGKTITSGLATGANEVHGTTLGVNWILNPFVLTRLDWQYLNFNRRVPVGSHFIRQESLITARLQTMF